MSKAKADPHGWPDYTYPMTIIGQELNVAIDIAAQSIPTLDVNIAASAVTLDVNIAESAVTLNVNIESISEGVIFNVAQSGTWTINAVQSGDWSINIQSVSEGVTFNVNITGSTATLDVNISSAVTLDVNITGSDVTLNVNIASSSVAINIKTETGANIVIDKLVESAYTEERHVLANNGDTPIMLAPGTSYRRGKYFPRGCRGFIHQIEVYCDNQDSIDRKLYIYVAPQPGMAPIISETLYVPASSSPAWRYTAVNKYWNYDSLFIWVLSETSSDPRVGYDEGAPPDYYDSTDGASWFPASRRLWIRLNMTAQTVGDLPVTGTLNTIEVPVGATGATSGLVSVEPNSSATLLTIDEPGCNLHLQCFTNNFSMRFYIECDGVKLRSGSGDYFSPADLHAWGYTASTPGVSLLLYNATEGNDNVFTVTLPFKWKRKLVISVYNPSSTSRNATVSLNYNKMLG